MELQFFHTGNVTNATAVAQVVLSLSSLTLLAISARGDSIGADGAPAQSRLWRLADLRLHMADGAPVTADRVRWLFEQVKRQATEWGALWQDPRYSNKKLTFGCVCPVGEAGRAHACMPIWRRHCQGRVQCGPGCNSLCDDSLRDDLKHVASFLSAMLTDTNQLMHLGEQTKLAEAARARGADVMRELLPKLLREVLRLTRGDGP